MEERININSQNMSEVRAYLAPMLSELALNVDLKDVQYEIDLTNDINAGADIVARKIILTVGVLKFCTRGELMYVIGHEAGHILKHGYGHRFEENHCDLLSAQRLVRARVSPEVIIHFFRKLALVENYNPWRQDYLSMIRDPHSPVEQRIKHIQTFLAALNREGENSQLTLANQNMPQVVSDQLNVALLALAASKVKSPENSTQVATSLTGSAKTIPQITAEVAARIGRINTEEQLSDIFAELRRLHIPEADLERIAEIEELIQVALPLPPTLFASLYIVSNSIIVPSDRARDESHLWAFGIYRNIQRTVYDLLKSDNFIHVQFLATQLHDMIKKCDGHQRYFLNKNFYITVKAELRCLQYGKFIEPPCFKMVHHPQAVALRKVLWQLGFQRDQSLFEAMLKFHPDELRRDVGDTSLQPFAGYYDFDDNFYIGKKYGSNFRLLKISRLQPLLAHRLMINVLLNKPAFRQEVLAMDFRAVNKMRDFIRRYRELFALKLKLVGVVEYLAGNQNSEFIAFFLECMAEKLGSGDNDQIASVKAFFEHINILSEDIQLQRDNGQVVSPGIPYDSPYVDFLINNKHYFKIGGDDGLFKYLFATGLIGEKRPLLYPNMVVGDKWFSVFTRLAGFESIKSVNDLYQVLFFYKNHHISPYHESYTNQLFYPDGALPAMLESLYQNLAVIQAPEIGERQNAIGLILFFKFHVREDDSRCLIIKNKLLKEKIQWLSPETILSDGQNAAAHYRKMPMDTLVPVYIILNNAYAFKSIDEQSFFSQMLISRLQDIPLKERIDFLHELVVLHSITDYQTRVSLIDMWAIAIKEDVYNRNRYEYRNEKEIILTVIKTASLRDRIQLLDRLSTHLQMQQESLLFISQQLGGSAGFEINDSLRTNAVFTGLEGLLRHISRTEQLRLDFIDYIVSPLSVRATEIIVDKIMAANFAGDARSSVIDGLLGTHFSAISEENNALVRHIMIMHLYHHHIEYHNLPIELKAVGMNYVLIPSHTVLTASDENNAYYQALDYVINKLLPLANLDATQAEHTAMARSFLHAYVEEAPKYTQYLIIAGLLAASYDGQQFAQRRRIGQILASVCSIWDQPLLKYCKHSIVVHRLTKRSEMI